MQTPFPGAGSSPSVPTLQAVEGWLAAGEPRRALELLSERTAGDPFLVNARAVVLLRLGRLEEALELFQRLTLQPGSLALAPDQPTAFMTNYATALLVSGNVRGCQVLLNDFGREEDPRVRELRERIALWHRSLSWRQRLAFAFYGMVQRPPEVGGTPGELVHPPTPRRPGHAA